MVSRKEGVVCGCGHKTKCRMVACNMITKEPYLMGVVSGRGPREGIAS